MIIIDMNQIALASVMMQLRMNETNRPVGDNCFETKQCKSNIFI